MHMTQQGTASLMYQIGALKQELERRASSLIGVERVALQEMSIRSPRFSPPELGFYQVMTWLYVFYHEAGHISLPFFIERFSTYDFGAQGSHRRHYRDVRRLRTYLQHNLNLDSDRDLELQRTCEDWFSKSCGSAIPRSDKEWNDCLLRILESSEAFLLAAIECVRAIERDESADAIVEQWSVRLKRFHSKHEFQNLVAIVIHDMGQDSLEPSRLTERFYDKWNKSLQFMSVDYIFEQEARRLIEQTLLSETESPQPVTGEDIMREFSIPPGLQVRRLLTMSKELYYSDPCGKEELINRLKSTMGWTPQLGQRRGQVKRDSRWKV